VSGQLQDHRAGRRKFLILGYAIKKLQVPNAVHVDRMVSRLLLQELRERAGVRKHRRDCKYASV